MGIYYEDPALIEDIDEEELEVIKNMNFRMYMFLRRLKTFTRQYGSIIAFFAAVLSITYTIYQFTGGNPVVVAVPIITILIFLSYLFLKKSKEEKIELYST